MTYAITGGFGANLFAIGPTTGAITVVGALNYEVGLSISFVQEPVLTLISPFRDFREYFHD